MSATSDGFRVDINIAEDFILGIHVMAVTRCNNRLAREFRGLDDIVQHFQQVIFRGNTFHIQQIAIVF